MKIKFYHSYICPKCKGHKANFYAKYCYKCCKRGGRHNWKGGRVLHSDGYIYILNPTRNPRYILEHRYKMEKKLRRKLLSTEHVHHINGNRLDNRLCNLQLLTISQHTSITLKKRWKDASAYNRLRNART